MFGLSGSHRTGKTTLAKALALDLGMPFFELSASRCMREAGFDPIAPMTIDERITAQNGAADVLERLIDGMPRVCLTDRTPVDFAAYMIAEVGMLNTTPEQGDRVNAYVDRCLRLANKSFGAIIGLQPLPIYTAEEGKPPANLAYQTHIQLVIEGLLQVCHVESAMIRTSDHEERMQYAREFIREEVEELNQLRAAAEKSLH